jgi:inhibitor of cysteine peptidase
MATVVATSKDNGATLHAHVGDELVVRLPETPGTGFRWHIDVSPVNLALRQDAFDPSGSGVGGQGTRTFEFHAQTAGTTVLGLKRWREWEGDASVAERFDATIHVD